jgi:hypothetical protein
MRGADGIMPLSGISDYTTHIGGKISHFSKNVNGNRGEIALDDIH